MDTVLLDVVHDRLATPEEFRAKVEHLYEHSAEESRDLIQLSDGRWLDRYTAPIVGDAGRHFGRLWAFRDVSEQRRMQERNALTIDLRSELGPEDRFSALVERTAYWIVQEALVDAARHAETDTARVAVRRCEAGLVLRVTDEGVGAGPSEEEGAKSFGLEGIPKR